MVLCCVKSQKKMSNVVVTFKLFYAHIQPWMQCRHSLRLCMCVISLQTLRSAIGMKESDEFAGLSSPKSSR